jgi:hypothetical protein
VYDLGVNFNRGATMLDNLQRRWAKDVYKRNQRSTPVTRFYTRLSNEIDVKAATGMHHIDRLRLLRTSGNIAERLP